jgi:hypothetical protein
LHANLLRTSSEFWAVLLMSGWDSGSDES